jgi:flagella basal body P-ring formation protein FlgA
MRKPFISLFGAAAIALILGSAAAAGEMVTLRAASRVDNAQIHLGDLFDNTGTHATDVVAAAPAAGNSTLFEAPWLAATARAHGLDWRPPSSFTAIRVDRASITIENAQIAARLVETVGKGSPDIRIVLDSQVRLYVPAGETRPIGVENVDINKETGHFTAQLRLPGADEMAQPVRVAGRIETMVNIPVLARAMGPGEMIRAEDISWTQMLAMALPSGDLLDPKDIVGRTPRHPLRADQALRPADLQIPVVVKRNELVLIVLERPGLYLTAEGKALEDGGQGKTIRVMNTQSNRAIDAIVLGAGRVAAQMSGVQQASAY